jgi:hypothetical protein
MVHIDALLDFLNPACFYITLGGPYVISLPEYKWKLTPRASVIAVYALLHQLFLRPIFFSPLRHSPGPSFGHPIYGQFKNIVMSEAGSSEPFFK